MHAHRAHTHPCLLTQARPHRASPSPLLVLTPRPSLRPVLLPACPALQGVFGYEGVFVAVISIFTVALGSALFV